MLTHELLTVAATAYENGRTAGQVTVFLLIGAVLYRFLLRPFLMTRVTRPVRGAIAGVGIVAIVLLGVAGSSASGEADGDRARAEMLAGCVDTGGEQQRSYCVCVVDEAMKRNGTTREDLARLNAQLEKVEEGGPVPAVMTDAIQLCLPKAPAPASSAIRRSA
jgi:hypothetical protein